MNTNQLNTDILRAFGVDTKCVTQADIQLRPGKFPEVNVTMAPWPLEPVGAMLKTIALRCHLVPTPAAAPEPEPEPPPLDIVEMCNTAQHCIYVAIQRAGDEALHQMNLRSAAYNSEHGYPLTNNQLRAAVVERRRFTHEFKPLRQFLGEWYRNA